MSLTSRLNGFKISFLKVMGNKFNLKTKMPKEELRSIPPRQQRSIIKVKGLHTAGLRQSPQFVNN